MTTLDIMERIVDERVNASGVTHYLIKWVYGDEDDTTWEPAKKIRGYPGMVEEWEVAKKKKGRAKGPGATSSSASIKGGAKAKNAKSKSSARTPASSTVVALQVEEPGPSGGEGTIGNLNKLPGMISGIMEGVKKSILEDVAKSLKEMEDRVKEKLEEEMKDLKDKVKGQEVDWKRKLEEFEEKQAVGKKVTAKEMNLAKKRKMEEKKDVDERKEMEERIKTLEANQLSLKDFFGNILEEEVDIDHLEDKIPRVLEKIKEINDNARKLDQIKNLVRS